ncbi:hypothetical protein Tco_1451394 [Tanacetum coccineum]
MVLDMVKSFPRGTSCGRDGLRSQHLLDCLGGAVVAIFDELVALKPGGGIRPIAMGTVWMRLVSKVNAVMIGHSLDGYLNDLQFGVGVSGGGNAILYAVNRKYAFVVLLFHVGWNFVTPSQLDYIIGNTPYGRIKTHLAFYFMLGIWMMALLLEILWLWGRSWRTRERCDDPTEADPKVLRDSRH